MNNILPSGLPRFNSASIINNLSFSSQSVIVGEYAGKNLPVGNLLYQNFFNTYVGYKAGQNTLNAKDTIYIGKEAGLNVRNSSNTIIIGRDDNEIIDATIIDSIAIGYNREVGTQTITIGYSQHNFGINNISMGRDNYVSGNNNINLGNTNVISNVTSSVFIGNDNALNNTKRSSNIIVIGNQSLKNTGIYFSNLIESEPILIGNHLYDDNRFTVNIGNSLVKYDNYDGIKAVILGNQTSPVITGIDFNQIDILDIDNLLQNNASLYARNAIFTDKMVVGNMNNTSLYTIGLVSNSNLSQNITYILPSPPESSLMNKNVALSLSSNNEMVWTKLVLNTDDVPEGNSNFYYNNDRLNILIDNQLKTVINQELKDFVDARIEADFYTKFTSYFNMNFNNRLPYVTLDHINNGTSNQMIVNGYYGGRMMINHLVVNKIEVVGYGNNYSTTENIGNNSAQIAELVESIHSTSNILSRLINSLTSRLDNIEQRLNRIGIF
jgi:hypothetical protein